MHCFISKYKILQWVNCDIFLGYANMPLGYIGCNKGCQDDVDPYGFGLGCHEIPIEGNGWQGVSKDFTVNKDFQNLHFMTSLGKYAKIKM